MPFVVIIRLSLGDGASGRGINPHITALGCNFHRLVAAIFSDSFIEFISPSCTKECLPLEFLKAELIDSTTQVQSDHWCHIQRAQHTA